MKRSSSGIYQFEGYEDDYVTMYFWDVIYEMPWSSIFIMIWHKLMGTYPRWIYEMIVCYRYLDELGYLPEYEEASKLDEIRKSKKG